MADRPVLSEPANLLKLSFWSGETFCARADDGFKEIMKRIAVMKHMR